MLFWVWECFSAGSFIICQTRSRFWKNYMKVPHILLAPSLFHLFLTHFPFFRFFLSPSPITVRFSSIFLFSCIFHDFSLTATQVQAGRWEISSCKLWKKGSKWWITVFSCVFNFAEGNWMEVNVCGEREKLYYSNTQKRICSCIELQCILGYVHPSVANCYLFLMFNIFTAVVSLATLYHFKCCAFSKCT